MQASRTRARVAVVLDVQGQATEVPGAGDALSPPVGEGVEQRAWARLDDEGPFAVWIADVGRGAGEGGRVRRTFSVAVAEFIRRCEQRGSTLHGYKAIAARPWRWGTWAESAFSTLNARISLSRMRGDDRNRTGVDGFAGRCVATPPRRRTGSDYRLGTRSPLASRTHTSTL
jgi:hypothetical protein